MNSFPDLTLSDLKHSLDLAKMIRATKQARADADKGKIISSEKHLAPEGWHAATDDELHALNIDREGDLEFPVNNKTGKQTHYFAQIFTNNDDPQRHVLAFPGTDPTNLEDLSQNIKNARGKDPFYYQKSRFIAQQVNLYGKAGKNEITGHSLGGGEAADASKDTGIKATTFAAMGPHAQNVQKPLESDVKNFYIGDDFAQKLPNIGFPMLYGHQIPLPRTTAEELAAMSSMAMMSDPDPLQFTGGFLTNKLFSLQEHGIDRIIQGLESSILATQKAQEAVTGAKESIAAMGGAFGMPPVCEGDMHLCPLPFHFMTPISVSGFSIITGGRKMAFTGSRSGCGAPIVGTGHLEINGVNSAIMGDLSAHGGVCVATTFFVNITKG